MMSSLKFSYWSSPHTSTKSGLKSSRILRIARKSLPNRSPQRLAAERPSSLPSAAMSSAGQLPGSFTVGSTLGAPSTRLNTPVSPSFGRHKVGQWVTPSPRISAICLFLSSDVIASAAKQSRADYTPRSGDHPKEPIVQLFFVIKDALADLIRRPYPRRVVGVIAVAAGEHLVAIARGIEEIDRLPARDAMPRRPDIKRDAVAGDDVCGMADIVPRFQKKSGVVKLARMLVLNKGDVVCLV